MNRSLAALNVADFSSMTDSSSFAHFNGLRAMGNEEWARKGLLGAFTKSLAQIFKNFLLKGFKDFYLVLIDVFLLADSESPHMT